MSKVTAKYQVTLPKNIRKELGVKPGDFIEFEKHKDEFVLKKKVKNPKGFEKYIGYLKNKKEKDVDKIIEKLRG
jgi:AbrB family looped-hinge helix DNA binding protein